MQAVAVIHAVSSIETSKHEITDNCIVPQQQFFCDSITEVSNDNVIQYVGIQQENSNIHELHTDWCINRTPLCHCNSSSMSNIQQTAKFCIRLSVYIQHNLRRQFILLLCFSSLRRFCFCPFTAPRRAPFTRCLNCPAAFALFLHQPAYHSTAVHVLGLLFHAKNTSQQSWQWFCSRVR